MENNEGVWVLAGRKTETDWTERRPHLAGHLGAVLLSGLLEAGWLRSRAEDRSLVVTVAGSEGLAADGVKATGWKTGGTAYLLISLLVSDEKGDRWVYPLPTFPGKRR